MRLCIRLTDFEVSRAKNAMITKLALSHDGTVAQCNEIGRQMLLEGYRTPFHKLAQDIQVMLLDALCDLCRRLLHSQDEKRVIGNMPCQSIIPLIFLRS